MSFNPSKVYNKVLILPDLHAPWIDWKAVQQAHKWAKRHKPDLIVQLGDLFDQKIWSRWPKDQDDYSPSEEYIQAEKALKLWRERGYKIALWRDFVDGESADVSA